MCFSSETINTEQNQNNDLNKDKEKQLLEEYEKIKKQKEEKIKLEEQQNQPTTLPTPILEETKEEIKDNTINVVEQNDNQNLNSEQTEKEKNETKTDFKFEENQNSNQSQTYISTYKLNNNRVPVQKPVYFGLSLLNLLLCCLPLGIVAVVLSSQAKKAYNEGFVFTGDQKANIALVINIVSIILGLIFWIIIIINAD